MKYTAEDLSTEFHHTSVDSNTVLINGGGVDLRVCGVGCEAFFEWLDVNDDPIGEVFDEISVLDFHRR